jgi:DNA invertase Pin-like site-specific DNA recombinase
MAVGSGVRVGIGGDKAADIAALKAEGLGASEIAKQLKIGRASVYRVLKAA